MLKSIAEHHLVPKHELLTKDEASTLLAQFGLDFDKLPRITHDDAMVEELKAKVGDVIRITRQSPVAGTTIYYRRVVQG
jgi:DNA-directed RNA polymerase subunit H